MIGGGGIDSSCRRSVEGLKGKHTLMLESGVVLVLEELLLLLVSLHYGRSLSLKHYWLDRLNLEGLVQSC